MKPWLYTEDMMGNMVVLPKRPARIISVVPSQTELLFDLGLEEEVVGITKFCVHPEKWFRTKERVGGTKDLKLEKIAALQPDLILANKEENERTQIEALRKIAPVWLSDIATLPQALRMIEAVGEMTGRAEKAAEIRGGIVSGFEKLKSFGSPKKVAYAIWRNPWMWAAASTFIDDLLSRMGWQNVLSDHTRYPEVTLAEMQWLQPDFILLSSEPYPFGEKHFSEVTAACPDASILLVDGEMFSWYGSRLLQAPAYLQKLIEASAV